MRSGWLLVLLLGTGCASAPPEAIVNVTYLASHHPATFHTWAVDLDDCSVDDDPRIDDGLLRPMVLEGVRRSLAARGFEPVEPARADFLVPYHLRIDEDELQAVRAWIYVRDRASGRYVWLAERRTAIADRAPLEGPVELESHVQRVVEELLSHLDLLDLPGHDVPGH